MLFSITYITFAGESTYFYKLLITGIKHFLFHVRCSCRWGGDYVSELQPPTYLLFIPQMIHEYRQPRWNNIDREKPIQAGVQLNGLNKLLAF
jgi:hypothetical protein